MAMMLPSALSATLMPEKSFEHWSWSIQWGAGWLSPAATPQALSAGQQT